ncbi:MAG: hypothetical protein ACRC35_07370 [Angustibacter sp.]
MTVPTTGMLPQPAVAANVMPPAVAVPQFGELLPLLVVYVVVVPAKFVPPAETAPKVAPAGTDPVRVALVRIAEELVTTPPTVWDMAPPMPAMCSTGLRTGRENVNVAVPRPAQVPEAAQPSAPTSSWVVGFAGRTLGLNIAAVAAYEVPGMKFRLSTEVAPEVVTVMARADGAVPIAVAPKPPQAVVGVW